jgi:hypothetical protein
MTLRSMNASRFRMRLSTSSLVSVRKRQAGEAIKNEAKRLEHLNADRACIETDHPSLPAGDAPAAAFLEWRSRVWQEGGAVLTKAVAEADQVLGRTRLLASFTSACSAGEARGKHGREAYHHKDEEIHCDRGAAGDLSPGRSG